MVCNIMLTNKSAILKKKSKQGKHLKISCLVSCYAFLFFTPKLEDKSVVSVFICSSIIHGLHQTILIY